MSLLIVAIFVSISSCVCRNFTELPHIVSVVDGDDPNFKEEIRFDQPINVTLERITEPMRHVFGEMYPNGQKNENGGNDHYKRSDDNFKPSPRDFRPSPQLDTNFEFNEQPVVPAIGEPRKAPYILQPAEPIKSSPSWRFPERNAQLPSATFNSFDKKSSTSDDVASYPTETSHIRTSASHPYNFVSDHQYEGQGEGHVYEIRTTTENSFYHKPVGSQVKEEVYEVRELGKYGNVPSRGLHYPKEELYEVANYDAYDRPPAISKTYYDHPHYPPQREYPNYKYLFLKKAVKFLAAVIPIGLLISALSPAVVNVTPINNNSNNNTSMTETMTMDTRRRTQKLLEDINNVSSPYDLDKIVQKECEERIICELIVGAQMSEYGIQNVERLFTAFIEQ
ncbi:uncharacterized protein LOC108735034 [Agrilus planipennis]|uniref:Uncharacterized protein LOC108735034 n=1 Tax=Agrilus planipennis TaxID=224129 RepID=A0A1W4WQL6_AGRPL|nr:uncharacterized protein LOC108735034 [Agrilus planipennis]